MRVDLEKKILVHFNKFFDNTWTIAEIQAVGNGTAKKVTGFIPAYAYQGGR